MALGTSGRPSRALVLFLLAGGVVLIGASVVGAVVFDTRWMLLWAVFGSIDLVAAFWLLRMRGKTPEA